MNTVKNLIPVSLLILPLSFSWGQWVKITDFEVNNFAELNASFSMSGAGGPLDNANGIPPLIALFPGPVDTENTVYFSDPLAYGIWWNAFHALFPIPEAAQVPDGNQATFYFRAYIEGTENAFNIGLTDIGFTPYDPVNIDEYKTIDDELLTLMATPNTWNDFQVQLRIQLGVIDLKHTTSFASTDLPGMPTQEWVEFWLYVDNASETWQLYTKSSATGGEIVQASVVPEEGDPFMNIDFTTGTDSPLTGIYIGMDAGNPATPRAGDPQYLDDFYMYSGSGAQLETPGGTPTTYGGYPIISENGGNYINTEAFLGWLEVTMGPWVYSITLNGWIYLTESQLQAAGGGWVYIIN